MRNRERGSGIGEQGAEGKGRGARSVAEVLSCNFFAGYRKPFNVSVMNEMTGLKKKIVREQIAEAVKTGELIEIEAGIYLVRRNDTVICAGGWNYSRSMAEAVLMAVKGTAGRNVRMVAAEMGYSRQYVFKYLEALATIGAIRWNGERYVVTGAGDMKMLGVEIEKGILGRMRKGER